MSFRLFISHSSGTHGALTRLDRLAEAIRVEAQNAGTTIQVLCDREQITGGDDWRARIAFLLHACHGGVVVLDKEALDSKWVLAEATVLSLRVQAGNGFRLVPVSFLSEEELATERAQRQEERRYLRESDWSVVALPDIQYVRKRTPEQVGAAVVKVLTATGQLTWKRPPIDRFASQFIPLLVGKADKGSLAELALELEEDGIEYVDADLPARSALAIARHMIRRALLTEARRQLKGLGELFPNDYRKQILEALSPLAMEAEAAGMLTRRRVGGGYAHVYLETSDPVFTIPRYIRRAHLSLEAPPYMCLPNLVGTFEGIRQELRAEYRAKNRHVDPVASNEAIDARINQERYVCVPGPVDAAVLAQLERAYPAVGFVIHHTPEQAPTVLPPGVSPIVPILAKQREQSIRLDYDLALEDLA